MKLSKRNFVSILALNSLLLVCSGCHTLHHGHTVAGVVQTGGQFAVPRSVPIPESGLSLATAVSENLRPWLTALESQPVVVVSQPQQVAQETSKKSLADKKAPARKDLAEFFELIRESAKENANDEDEDDPDERRLNFETAVDSHVQNLENSNTFTSEQREQLIETIVNKFEALAQADGTQQPDGELKALETQIGEIVPKTAAPPTEGAPEEGEQEQSEDAPNTDSAASQTSDKTVFPASRAFATASGQVDNSADFRDLAVVLTRQNKRRIIAPLWLVQRHAAGDIQLSDGDRIDVVHFHLTEVGSRLRGKQDVTFVLEGAAEGSSTVTQNNYSLPQIASALDESDNGFADIVDVIVIRHIGATGMIEEYLVPRHTQAFGPDNKGRGWLDEVVLLTGDVVRMDNLQLLPAIQQGQIASVRATAVAIRRDPRADRLLGKLEAKKLNAMDSIRQRVQTVTGL